MTNIKEIQVAIESLSEEDYSTLRKWFSDRDWAKWDRQIAKDSRSGKLDFLIRDAVSDKENEKLKDL
jgi:hypothetical protein